MRKEICPESTLKAGERKHGFHVLRVEEGSPIYSSMPFSQGQRNILSRMPSTNLPAGRCRPSSMPVPIQTKPFTLLQARLKKISSIWQGFIQILFFARDS